MEIQQEDLINSLKSQPLIVVIRLENNFFNTPKKRDDLFMKIENLHKNGIKHIEIGWDCNPEWVHLISEIKNNQVVYNWDLLYDKSHYIKVYEKRNKEITNYFTDRKSDLLIFNVNENRDISKILSFLNLSNQLNFNLPHELKSNYK